MQLRQFFTQKNVLEVETPVLAGAPVTDLHIQSFATEFEVDTGKRMLYLQTSPEFAMKRLLAAHSNPIYQIGKVFRQDPISKQHNPEFTMLEWYRPGFSLDQLMDEVSELLLSLLNCDSIKRFTYRELFENYLDINPHNIESEELAALAREKIELSADEFNDTDYLQLLMSAIIEPQLPALCFVYNYPQEQACLSVIEESDQKDLVGRRFEVYCQGMELANGFLELLDAEEQRQRFASDNAAREKNGLEAVPIDEKFLAALAAGMPACSGVALGVDRLLMAMHGINDIDQAMSFTTQRA